MMGEVVPRAREVVSRAGEVVPTIVETGSPDMF